MRVNLFDFELPENLIAQEPVYPRDASRLLEIRPDGEYHDHNFSYLLSLLKPNDLLVFNDTKVIPSRLKGKRGTASVEVTLHKKISESIWKAFAKPARKLNVGDVFIIADDFQAEVTARGENGEVELEFNFPENTFDELLNKYGIMPLPPYIKRKEGAREQDTTDYQTVFASIPGAVAAPTAGLHFTEEMLKNIKMKGIKTCFVTLHVGAGTFLPIKSEDTKEHVMHKEWFSISKETAALINETKNAGGRVIAVGTTSLRTMESAADKNGKIQASQKETGLFIVPGYNFRIVDALLTNFHLPRSTLFMLVCAFAGMKNMHDAYTHAINNKYRFFSYGDACFLHRNDVITDGD